MLLFPWDSANNSKEIWVPGLFCTISQAGGRSDIVLAVSSALVWWEEVRKRPWRRALARHTPRAPRCSRSASYSRRSSKPLRNGKVQCRNTIRTVSCSLCVAQKIIFFWGCLGILWDGEFYFYWHCCYVTVVLRPVLAGLKQLMLPGSGCWWHRRSGGRTLPSSAQRMLLSGFRGRAVGRSSDRVSFWCVFSGSKSPCSSSIKSKHTASISKVSNW